MKTLSRTQLYSLVWETPISRLAPTLGISDVALNKICRRNNIPTPPPGYWAKLSSGKRVEKAPLQKVQEERLIHIRQRFGLSSVVQQAEFLGRIVAALGRPTKDMSRQTRAILDKSFARLAKAKSGADGLVHVKHPGLVCISVRLELVERATAVLQRIAEKAGLDGSPPPSRVGNFLEWAKAKLSAMESEFSAHELEAWLASRRYFDHADDGNEPPLRQFSAM